MDPSNIEAHPSLIEKLLSGTRAPNYKATLKCSKSKREFQKTRAEECTEFHRREALLLHDHHSFSVPRASQKRRAFNPIEEELPVSFEIHGLVRFSQIDKTARGPFFQTSPSMSLEFAKLILLGDSITEYSCEFPHGLQPQLASYYSRRLDVINRGFAGYNSTHLVRILPKVLDAERNVRFMTIFIGTNDATLMSDRKGVIQAVLVAEYTKNLNRLVDFCLDRNIFPILIGPALHDPVMSARGLVASQRSSEHGWGSSAQNRKYSEACAQVAKTRNVPFVDLWNAFREAGGWSCEQVLQEQVLMENLLVDGIHFTDRGYQVLTQAVINTIESHIPQFTKANLTQRLAYYGDINPEDLDSIFRKDQIV